MAASGALTSQRSGWQTILHGIDGMSTADAIGVIIKDALTASAQPASMMRG